MSKRILIISGNFCLEAGGIENTSYLLADHLSKYAEVITFSPEEGAKVSISGVQSYHSRVPFDSFRRRPLYMLDSFKVIRGIHKKTPLDYILCTHYTYGFSAFLMNRIYGIPYGVMTHGSEVYKKWFKQKTLVLQIVWFFHDYIKRQLMLNHATQLFSNTFYTKELVIKITKNRNVFVVNPPIGIEPESIDNICDRRYILSLGRLVERKGYHLVLKSFPALLRKCPEVKYVIAGSGEYEIYLKQLVRELGLDNNVIFKGRVTEDEKKELMRNCSLFVLPSYEIPSQQSVEGFGLSLLEANMYGKFVISSVSGGIPEAVDNGKTGILVKENDVNSLSDALLEFFDIDFKYDPQYCVQWAQRCYITNIAHQYFNYILESLKQHAILD